MPSFNPSSYYRHETGRVSIKPVGDANFYLLGNTTAIVLGSNTSTVDITESEKGFTATRRELTSNVKYSYEVTVNEITPEIARDMNYADAISDSNQAAIVAPAGTASFTGVKYRTRCELGKVNVVNVVVQNAAGTTTYIPGTDYELDAGAGYFQLKRGGAIVEGSNLNVTFGCSAVNLQNTTALKTLTREGDIIVELFDQHAEVPVETHKFRGQYRITDRGTVNGNSIREVKMMILAIDNPKITLRKDA